MCYTNEQKALIGGVIGSHFMGRNISQSLRDSFAQAYAHLQTDKLSAADLRRIESALAFLTPQTCPTCNKEGYRDMIEALMATRLMLREVSA